MPALFFNPTPSTSGGRPRTADYTVIETYIVCVSEGPVGCQQLNCVHGIGGELNHPQQHACLAKRNVAMTTFVWCILNVHTRFQCRCLKKKKGSKRGEWPVRISRRRWLILGFVCFFFLYQGVPGCLFLLHGPPHSLIKPRGPLVGATLSNEVRDYSVILSFYTHAPTWTC